MNFQASKGRVTSHKGASCFGIKISILWYGGGRSLFFGIEISFFGIAILHSVVQHQDRRLPGINPCVFFGASTSCTLLTFSLPIREDFCSFLDFPGDRGLLSTFFRGYVKHCDR